jgi:hypothetical protein
MRIDWLKPAPSTAGMIDAAASSGVVPNSMIPPTTSGAS